MLNCCEKVHVKSECHGPKKNDDKTKVNNVHAYQDYGDDLMVCCVESMDYWVMDSGLPFFARHNG